MANQSEGVYVTFGADTSGLKKGVKEAKSELKALGDEIRTGATDLAKWGAAGAAAAAIGAGAIIKSSIDAAKELQTLSRVANASVADFQAMAFGARSVGIEQDKLADILKDVKDRVGDFISTGGGPMADFFENIAPKVGVTAEQFRKLSGPESLQLFVSSLEKANLSQAEMTFYMEAMASDSTRLIPLLRDGGEAMAEQAREAERLGLILSDIDHQRLLQGASAMAKFEQITSAASQQISSKFAPLMQGVLELFTESIEKSGGLGKVVQGTADIIVEGIAFAANAVDGLKRAFEMAADGIIIFTTTVGGAILENVGRPIRLLLEGLSMLPGELGSMADEFATEYDSFFAHLEGVAAEAGKNINETLMAPLAGDVMKEKIKQAMEASTAAAEEVLANNPALATGGGGLAPKGTAKDEEEAKAKEEEQKKIEERLAALQQSLMTENEIIALDYETKRAMAREAFDNKLLDELEYGALELSIEADKQARLTEIDARAAEERKRLAEMEAQAKRQALQTFFNDASTLMNSGSKKAFEIGKKAAIASAVVNGYESAVAAWDAGMSTGGPWAPVIAAAYTAASLARTGATINAIRSQQFGGGAGGAVGGGGMSATQAVNAANTPVNTGGGNPLEVRFTGISADRNYSGREISTLFDRLREEAGDRGMRLLPVGT